MKEIKKTKLYKYAKNWLLFRMGKQNLNPMLEIERLLKEAIKELENEKTE